MSGSPGVDFMSRQNASLNEANRGVRKVINKALRRQTRGSIVKAVGELSTYGEHASRSPTELLDELIEEALTQ